MLAINATRKIIIHLWHSEGEVQRFKVSKQRQYCYKQDKSEEFKKSDASG